MASSFRQQIGCGVLIVGSTAVLVAMLLMVSQVRFADAHEVTVSLEDAVGMTRGRPVRVAGVQVGSVSDVGVQHDRALLTLAIDADAALRKDVRVRLRSESVLGEKYVELIPQTLDAPLLADGDVLEPGGTHTEIDELVDALGRLVSSVDPEAIDGAMKPVTEALQSDPDRLARLLANADETLQNAAVASRELPAAVRETRSALVHANRTLDEVDHTAARVGELITRADAVLADLESAAEPLPETVAKANAALDDVRAAIEPMTDATGDLSRILENFSDVDQETLRRLLREDGVRVHLFGDGKKKRKEK